MIRYVAFLRGINVGGHKLVKMDALRRIFEDAGLANVGTYIQSGNVVFDSAERDARALEVSIEARLAGALGFGVAVIVRTFGEVEAVVRHEPFAPGGADDGATVYVTFMREKPGAGVRRELESLSNDDVDVRVKDREVFILVRRNVSAVDAVFSNPLLGKKSGAGTTTRNRKTLSKIVARFAPRAD